MKNFRLTLFAAAMSISLSSCLKQSYDNPPDLTTFDPGLTVNLKIRDLVKPLWGTNGAYRILGDSTIYGIVVADDRSGNFYKQIVIQDSTAGINISIANTYLYNDYPIGRKVYIKLNGLYITSYKGNPELAYNVTAGGNTVTGIPPTLQDTFIVKASYPHTVTPLECRLTDLSFPGPYQNTLIKLDNMQFDSASMNVVYALPSSAAVSTSRNLVECNNGSGTAASITLYNSSYSNFFNAITPSGYGTITGIFALYGSTNQFQIRDTTDVQMTQPRCH